MPISSGTVSKGEKQKSKFQSLNLNNVFSQSKGESSKPNQQKALYNKNGMSVLGKVPSARKPLNLPSLKSESTGNDPPVNLVPTGGSGWGNKPGEVGPPPPVTAVVTTPPITTINTSVPPPPIVDKSWSAKIAGKPSNPPNYNSAHQSPLFHQEFPSLSGSGNADVQYGPGPSLRPQTEGSWIQGGSHPMTGGEVGNQQGIAPVQDHPTETLRPEVAAILPSFMMKQETQFANFTNPPPPRVAPRFPSHPPNHDNRFMQHPPPSRNKDFQCAKIVKDEELSKLDNVSKEGGWTLHDQVDYNKKLNFSDDEAEESENKENKISKSSAISENSGSQISDQQKLLKKKEFNEILEKAKVRKESEEQRFLETKMNANKKFEELTKNIEERKRETEHKEERKTTGQPVVKDGNEFRQLTQLSSDKPQSYKDPTYSTFPSNNSRFSTMNNNNKPPRLRKPEGSYRSHHERNYYDGDYERENHHREFNPRDNRFVMNNSRNNRDFRNTGYDNRKYLDQKSNYNRDPDIKYQGRYSDSSEPSQRDSWEREAQKRKDSDRSKQSYEDENDRYRSDNDGREKTMKDHNSWETDKHDDYEERWGDHTDYDREEGLWDKDVRRLERPTRPDSRDSRTSRESRTSHSDHNVRDEKLNIIDDPEETIEKERKPLGFMKNTRGAGVPITKEKVEAAESKQDKPSVLVPLVRSDYKKEDKEEEKKLPNSAWRTPLNKANFQSDQKKEDSPPGDTVVAEPHPEKQSSEEPVEKESKDRAADRKDAKDVSNKKDRGDRDAHHKERSGRGGRYQQGGRSNEWSNNYNVRQDDRRNWPREGKEQRYDNRRGHGRENRAPPSRSSYSRHNRSESDPESGKEERSYHENIRERRSEKGRKERDDGWYNDRDRYNKERDHYYDGRGSREYSQRGGSGYRSNQSSGQGRRMEYGNKNFSGDEKKPREKKEPTSEDDKKEKKVPAKPVGKPREKNEKDWESDGKESLDDDKYKRSGYSSRGSRGARQTYGARKNEKFSKERPVKEENKEDIETSEVDKLKESADSKVEHGFQEVKAKKPLGKETSAPKKVEDKGKPREASKPASGSQGTKGNNSGKASTPQHTGKPASGEKAKSDGTAQQKKDVVPEEPKITSFSSAKDVMTGPPPPPPATNAWDKPLNSAVLKSASPAPSKTSTPPPRPASSASSNAPTEIGVSHQVQDESSQIQSQQQQQYVQQQQQQSLAEHQQQLQAQQLAAVQKQQQVQQQALEKIDNCLLDGTNTSVPTMLFENRNYKSVEYRPKETLTIEDYKQQHQEIISAISKEDSSAADMKLDFTYGSDLSSGAEDHKNLVSHHHNLQHHNMVQSSAVELNWKIASVKSFWEDSDASKQVSDAMVNAFPVPHSGGSGHFSVVQATGSGVSQGQDGSPVTSAAQSSVPQGYKSSGGGETECGPSAAEVAELHGMYGAMPRGMSQSAQQQVYANTMSVKDQQELAKLSKQQLAAAVAPTPTVMSTPPPPQQQTQQSYAPAPHYAPSPAHPPYSALPSQTAAAAMLYSATPLQNQGFGNFSVEQTAQLLSSAQGGRQPTTQYPFLSLGQTFNHQSPNMFIHQASTPSAASDLASQMSAGYRLTGGPPSGYASTGAGLSTSAGPPNPTLYIQSAAAAVKTANSGVPPIGTKTSYQPSPQSQQVYIPANMYADHTAALLSQSYLSQPTQQRPAPTGSSFYSTGTGGTSAQPTSYYANTYAASSPYNLGYSSQSPAPTGAQQMSSVGMGKPVVSNKYSQPPPQASAQTGQVKYASYQPGVVSQAQMMQSQQQANLSQQAGGQQQVLLTPAHQQQQSNQ